MIQDIIYLNPALSSQTLSGQTALVLCPETGIRQTAHYHLMQRLIKYGL